MASNIAKCLQCPVCQDDLVVPMVLPRCGHSFCYSCVKTWCQSNPNCPICRQALDSNPPVLNHTLNSVTAIVFPAGYNSGERLAEYKRDEQNGFPWLAKFKAKFGIAVVDDDDNVPRCSACHWELVDGQCENCGRTMVGWQDRNDVHVDLNSENEDDGWETERRMRRFRGPVQLDSDHGNYDNGLNDRVIDDEADEDYFSNGDDDVNWGSDDELPQNERRRPTNVYESVDNYGDTILLDSDGERPIPGHPTRLIKLSNHDDDENDTSHWNAHEDHVTRKPWLDEYESDDGFVVNDDEDDEDEGTGAGISLVSGDEMDETFHSDNLASGDEDLLEINRRDKVVTLESDKEDDARGDIIEVDDVFSDDEEDADMINSLKSSIAKKQIRTIIESDDEDNDKDDDDDDIIIVKRKGFVHHGDDEDDDMSD